MILSGSFKTAPLSAALALGGVVLGAVYMLTLYLRCMYGELDETKNGTLWDVTRLELCTLIPLAVMVFYMGIYPDPILRRIEPTVAANVEFVTSRRETLKRLEAAAKAQVVAEGERRGVLAFDDEGGK